MNYLIFILSVILSLGTNDKYVSNSNNITLSTTYNSNQWIDFTWTSVSGAVTYEIEGLEHSGNGVIVQEGSNFSARAYPTEDPYGHFSSFTQNQFGFASFTVYAYDSSGNQIGSSNTVSYGILVDLQQCGLLCNFVIGLCNISTESSPGQSISCE